MSQTQQPEGSQATEEAIEEVISELINEISFQKVLLASIDDSVDDREAAEDEVRTEIRRLEREVSELRRGSGSTITKPASSSSDFIEAGAASSPRSSPRQPDRVTTDLPSTLMSPRHHSSDSTDSLDSLPELLTPSKMDLPTRKRSHSKHLDGAALSPGSKSKRMSPSPFKKHPSNSSPVSGDVDLLNPDSAFFKQQKAAELRIQREKEDEALAKSLNGAVSQPVNRSAVTSSGLSGPSAFDRMAGIRPRPTSSMTRPSSSIMPNHASFAANQPYPGHVSPGHEVHATQSLSDIRRGPSGSTNLPRLKTQNPARSMPGAFRTSSDSEDSDIEVISATEFNNTGRLSSRPTAPRQTEHQLTNSALRRAAYGTKAMPSWMTGSLVAQDLTSPALSMNSQSPYSSGAGVSKGSPLSSSSRIANYQAGPRPYGTGAPTPTAGEVGTGYPGYTGNPGYNMNHHGTGPGNALQNVNSMSTPAVQFGHPALVAGGSMRSVAPIGSFDEALYGPYQERISEQLDYIMNDPRKTNEEIKALIENIRPDEELPAENREGTPEGLKYPLYEHQKLALTWLKSMEEGSKGAILADEMGLGKTIQALALILSRPSSDRLRKTTLLVGPVALVRQWEREIHKKIKPGHRLSTHMAHGGRKLSWDELRNYDVVLTSYNTLAAEYKRWNTFITEQHAAGRLLDRDIDEGPLRKNFPLMGPKSLFYRVILDEAQCIKNKNTMAAKAAYHLKSITRICLTGTPMMNNVGELFSLIHFLRIRPYSDYKKFQEDFAMLTRGSGSQGQSERAMRKLQALLKAILLRRMKTSLIDGKPLITLPPKTEEITHVVFSEDEQAFYNGLESKSRIQFNKYLRANTVGKNYSNILVLLLRLRQCCCHPHLITDFEAADAAGALDIPADAMLQLAEGLTADIINRLLEVESFECPVCYDAVDNPVIFSVCGHDTCSECLTKISDQANQQNVVNGDDVAGGFRCPSCRANVEKNKILDYATFKKVHAPSASDDADETANRKNDSDDSDDDSTESESDSDTESEDDADGNGDLRDFIVPDDFEDDDEDEAQEGKRGGDKVAAKEKTKSKGKEKAKSKGKEKAKSKGKRKGFGTKEKPKDEKRPKKKHISIAMLKAEASKSVKGRTRYMRYLRKHWQPSAKVTKCVDLLEQFHADGQKTIVFSQFVSLLDLLEVPIMDKGWECERYDGSMSADARNDAINRFTDKPNIKIMLISLKAGNAGLNLVAASRVIILDPFWNPFVEMQAVDRAHRIGQQRPVEVHRILIQKTVEDRIIELQERKKKLVDEALSEGASKSLGRLGVRELGFLFGVEDGPSQQANDARTL